MRLGFRAQADLYVASVTIEEAERNLSLKAPIALPAFLSFCDLLKAKIVEPPDQLVLTAVGIVVAKDTPILAAAIQIQARFLATYDRKHLLSHKEQIQALFGITVALPDEIIGELG